MECKHCDAYFERHHYKQVFCKPKCKIAYWSVTGRQRAFQMEHKKANPEKRLWKAAKGRATAAGIEFNIDTSDIVIPEFCPALGCRLESGVGHGKGANPNAPSLDRIVPALGYTKGNVQVISFKANSMKRDASEEELETFATWILNTLKEGD